MIDRHNRIRQDSLALEKSFQVKEWSLRVNSTLLGMCITDAYLLFRATRVPGNSMSVGDFFWDLGAELIDNTYDSTGLRHRSGSEGQSSSGMPLSSAGDNENTLVELSGNAPRLTPTKTRRGVLAGRVEKARIQRKCRVCGMKCSEQCSKCRDELHVDRFFCSSKNGRDCFKQHSREFHGFSL